MSMAYSQEIKIILPPRGFLIRDLLLSGLYILAHEGSALNFTITENYAYIKFPSKEAFMHGIKQVISYDLVSKRFSECFTEIINTFKMNRNYKSSIQNILNIKSGSINLIANRLSASTCKDPYSLINGACGSNGSIPLLFPESIESTRWFGGWVGDPRRKKLRLDVDPVLSFIALLGFCNFFVAKIVTRGKDRENLWLLAPIDSTVGISSLFNVPIRVPKIQLSIDILRSLSQLGRLLMSSLLIRGSRSQKIVTLVLTGYRAEIIENIPSSIFNKFTGFSLSLSDRVVARLLKMTSRKFIKKLSEHGFKGNDKKAISDIGYVINTIAKSVFDSLNGHLGPEEAAYFIARESFMRVPYYVNTINDVVVRDIRDSLRAQLLVGG